LSNDASFVTPEQVAKIRAQTADQKVMYKYADLMKSVPFELPSKELKATASHTVSTRIGGNASANSAFNYEGWSTGEKQAKGMWYQIEFPKEVNLSELHFSVNQTFKKGWKPPTAAERAAAQKAGTPLPQPTFVHTFPRNFIAETSLDGQTWQTVLANAKGTQGDNKLYFKGEKAKFLRLKLNEDLSPKEDEVAWAMRQMKVFVQN
jgi:hypothetical protein